VSRIADTIATSVRRVARPVAIRITTIVATPKTEM
jgi:hypothetical protein